MSSKSEAKSEMTNEQKAAIFGYNLKMLREARGLTQPELAKIIDASQPTIHRAETGQPTSGSFKTAIASYFGKSVLWMVQQHEPHEYYPDKPIDQSALDKIKNEAKAEAKIEAKIEILQDQLRLMQDHLQECRTRLNWYDQNILEHLQK